MAGELSKNVTDDDLNDATRVWTGEEAFELTNAQLHTVLISRRLEVEGDANKRNLVKALMEGQIAAGMVAGDKPEPDENGGDEGAEGAGEGELPEQDANEKLNIEDNKQEALQKQAAESVSRTAGGDLEPATSVEGGEATEDEPVVETDPAIAAKNAELEAENERLKHALQESEAKNAEQHARLKAGPGQAGLISDLGKTPGWEEEAPANGVKA